jgi:hypothetical protein
MRGTNASTLSVTTWSMEISCYCPDTTPMSSVRGMRVRKKARFGNICLELELGIGRNPCGRRGDGGRDGEAEDF